ncbi:hypothetical protein WJX84_001839 [Apatococcus fuscideae]|uniref:Photolyase/cryptochrome alpha/beta domain-containing protein n=1 Tax=Apatococcus fuscideae TaxID=2026836 RepID=A0AAW1STU6_9CHLO
MDHPKANKTPGSASPNEADKQLDTVLVWFRRDLRVADNPALTAALQAAKTVIPVYVWAPEEEGQFQPGRCLRWWIHNSLAALEKDLQALGSRLIFLRAPESAPALTQLLRDIPAQARAELFFNHLYDPISLVRDNEVKAAVAELHVHCQSFNGDVLYEPWEVLSDENQPLTSFASFWDRCMQMPYQPPWPLPVPSSLTAVPDCIGRLDLDSLGLMSSQEQTSNDQLQHNGCGQLPAFHAADGLPGIRPYLSFHFPFTHERSLLEHLRFVPWRLDQRLFKAWRQGCTGFPLVDAGMRQLWSTGWIHNRSRVVCASFLVKNLLLPWQWGLKHYWDALLDADLECDALGWQYCSGCLVDAHPFACLMDPVKESERFDPDGNYVRRWLPVLARLPKKWIHRPSEAPADVLADADVELGANYPAPIVSMQESFHCLQAASKAVHLHADWPQEARKVPYRPAPFPPSGHPSHRTQNPRDPAQQMREAGERVVRQAGGAHTTCVPSHSLPPQPDMTESDEEVVSNSCCGSVFANGAGEAQPPSVRKGMPNGVAQPHIPNGTHRPHRQLSAPATPAHHDTPMEQAETWPSKRRHINGHGDVGSGAGCTGPMSVFNDAHGQAAARGDAAAPPSSGNHPPGTAGQPTQNGDQPPRGIRVPHGPSLWGRPMDTAPTGGREGAPATLGMSRPSWRSSWGGARWMGSPGGGTRWCQAAMPRRPPPITSRFPSRARQAPPPTAPLITPRGWCTP